MNTLGLFFQVLLYETIQNIPTMCGFVVVAWLWVHAYHKSMWGIVIVCAMVSAYLVEVLEPYKVAGTAIAYEPMPFTFGIEVVGNLVAFVVTALLGLAYTQAKWSSRRTDILVGVALGLVMAVVQGIGFLSDPTNTFSLMRTITHTGAFIISGPLALLAVRILKQKRFPAMLTGTLLLTLLLSVIITVVDYGSYIW